MPSRKGYTVTLTLEQVLEVMDQLSDADTLKILDRIRKKHNIAVVEDLIVKMNKRKVAAMVK